MAPPTYLDRAAPSGTVAIDSTPGQGTRVAVELPCQEPPYVAAVRPREQRPAPLG